MKPTLRLTEDELPIAKGWKVGENYKITLEVKQIETRDLGGKLGFEFEITDAEGSGGENKSLEARVNELESSFETA
jgi:hypothetical protein